MPSSPAPRVGRLTRGQRWTDLFRRNRACSQDTALQQFHKQKDRLKLAAEDTEPLESTVGFCLVGRFLGRFPRWPALKRLTAQWNAPHKLHTHNYLWLVFQFTSKDLCDEVLKGGPYITYGCPLYLKVMPPCFTFQSGVHNQLPIWLQIHGLPIDCWSTSGLSKIASQLGTPLFTDRFTKQRERVNYARVLLEIDITQPPPLHMEIMLPDGQDVELDLRYETILKLCTVCRQLGHYQDHCPALNPIGQGGHPDSSGAMPDHSKQANKSSDNHRNLNFGAPTKTGTLQYELGTQLPLAISENPIVDAPCRHSLTQKGVQTSSLEHGSTRHAIAPVEIHPEAADTSSSAGITACAGGQTVSVTTEGEQGSRSG